MIVTVHEAEIARRHQDLQPTPPDLQSVCGLQFVALAIDMWDRVTCRNCIRITKARAAMVDKLVKRAVVRSRKTERRRGYE